MRAYYNEIDAKAAAWLRELIRRGLIAVGDVDERSITDVRAADLAGYVQCHFFAGIGGWSYALRLAGWPDDRPVWTGSCPCQPFSCAGKQLGAADARHLWPAFANLIRECRTVAVFGEQVAGAIGKGWLDGVRADMEAAGYAVGAAVLGAHSVGAPHIRQRLYWVADSGGSGLERLQEQPARKERAAPERSGRIGGVGDPEQCGLPGDARRRTGRKPTVADAWRNSVWLPCRDGKARRVKPGIVCLAHGVPARVVRLRGYGNAIVPQVAAEFIGAYLDTAEDRV